MCVHKINSMKMFLLGMHLFICVAVSAASLNERVMGEHLRTWSEKEYTNAGEVMQNVGKTQEGDAKKRLVKEK